MSPPNPNAGAVTAAAIPLHSSTRNNVLSGSVCALKRAPHQAADTAMTPVTATAGQLPGAGHRLDAGHQQTGGAGQGEQAAHHDQARHRPPIAAADAFAVIGSVRVASYEG
jgi:hypothetical protein